MDHSLAVVAAIVAAMTRHMGARHALIPVVRDLLLQKSRLGAYVNVVRVDSFGLAATGDLTQFGRIAFFVHGATDQQRRLSRGEEMPWVFIDLDRADDVAYILAARDELRSTYGVEPVTIYGQERIRAATDGNTVANTGD